MNVNILITQSLTRRNAMDNASKNATDMIASLQMQYNRGRQAAITNELVDIITGALPFLPFSISLFLSSFYLPTTTACHWPTYPVLLISYP